VKPNQWFGTIVLFTLLTMLIVYVVPSDSPFSVLSYVFGFTFVSIAPGYCLVTLLFPAENKLDSVEKAVLSVALSFSLVGLSGLFLGLSPIGLNFTSIRVSVCIMVLVLAAVAFLRKRSLGEPDVQSSEQVST
jgi:uncharacterized membrane protein